MDARMKEFVEACNEDTFAILMINIADSTLKNRLRRDYDDDAHGAWTYTEHLHERLRTTILASPRFSTSARPWWRRAWHLAPRLRRAPVTRAQFGTPQGSAHNWSDN
eukprot:920017-Pleurochrysis_carterae.AAC.1